jgi:hypothetical protein
MNGGEMVQAWLQSDPLTFWGVAFFMAALAIFLIAVNRGRE